MMRPRGTAAALGFDMYIVRGGALPPAAAAGAGAPMRVPHAPQNAKPGVTMRPQFGHAEPSTVLGPEEFAAAVPAAGLEDHAGASEVDVAEAVVGEEPPMYPEADALAAAVPAADAPPF
jgi:hypothetical protein